MQLLYMEAARLGKKFDTNACAVPIYTQRVSQKEYEDAQRYV
ncbi:MAG: hypothetical protein BWY74_01817 [Firmicutes bacterium ADurb.Bin419]|nr:MAG: hypothetical protein BWY74_01817 [Firmicutes bacterium ADurb.Bin419]